MRGLDDQGISNKIIAVSLHEVCLWGRLVWLGSNFRQDCHRLGYKEKVSGVVVRWQELGESMFAESKFCRWIGKQICWSDESLIWFVGRFSSMWSFTRSWRCGEVGRQIQESRDLDLLRELTQIWVLPWLGVKLVDISDNIYRWGWKL